jgi:GNAT superfamily N-acetyltransferase
MYIQKYLWFISIPLDLKVEFWMLRFASTVVETVSFKRIFWGTPDYEQMLNLRDLVLRKPLGMVLDRSSLGIEKNAFLYLAVSGPDTIGTALFFQKSPITLWLKQFAIHPLFHRKSIGSTFLKYLESEAVNFGVNEVYVHARDVALQFYEKQNYVIISDAFLEVGISHHAMHKLLSPK